MIDLRKRALKKYLIKSSTKKLRVVVISLRTLLASPVKKKMSPAHLPTKSDKSRK